MNFLQETIDYMKAQGIEPSDVLWVGHYTGRCSWEEFAEVAREIDYNPFRGYSDITNAPATPIINPELIIVGSSWWMSRMSGTAYVEWWAFHSPPEEHRKVMACQRYDDSEHQVIGIISSPHEQNDYVQRFYKNFDFS